MSKIRVWSYELDLERMAVNGLILHHDLLFQHIRECIYSEHKSLQIRQRWANTRHLETNKGIHVRMSKHINFA